MHFVTVDDSQVQLHGVLRLGVVPRQHHGRAVLRHLPRVLAAVRVGRPRADNHAATAAVHRHPSAGLNVRKAILC